MKNLILLLSLITLFYSCEEDKVSDSITPFTAQSGGVYISNEGNFQSANSSVSYFNPSNVTIFQDVYEQANSQSPGDICQSMKMINNKLYLVVNNSGKIEICDPLTMRRIQTITGLGSPRYILPVNATKAYVTDTYSNLISIVDLGNNSVTGTINLNGWTEQMISSNNKIFVTNTTSNYLFILDPANDVVSDSILISKGANSICEDVNGKLWVLCGGDFSGTYVAFLYRINPTTNQAEIGYQFASSDFPLRLCINGTGDSLYYINNGVFKMSIASTFLPSTPFVSSSGNNFYGLGIDKVRNEIYVSDAIDYIQRGRIFRYKADGTAIDNFLAGIIPGDFLFLP